MIENKVFVWVKNGIIVMLTNMKRSASGIYSWPLNSTGLSCVGSFSSMISGQLQGHWVSHVCVQPTVDWKEYLWHMVGNPQRWGDGPTLCIFLRHFTWRAWASTSCVIRRVLRQISSRYGGTMVFSIRFWQPFKERGFLPFTSIFSSSLNALKWEQF